MKALAKNPNFRSTSLSSLKSVENCLSSMSIERSALGRIFDMYPQLLNSDPYSDLYPIFDFLLNDVHIPFPDIRKSIIRCPRLLICSAEILLVSSVEGTLMPKLDYLMSLGLEYEEVVNMVLRSPGLLTFSIENNYRPKVEYFLNEMNGDEMLRFSDGEFNARLVEMRLRLVVEAQL
ncbi:unnamed protein product [Ilex paraguariensis]|uniref:Uncharacterized protein n=1 Tax=Ilex paraguariensis TaxID=185542 RepID=A0ABC8QUA2_9AQUA